MWARIPKRSVWTSFCSPPILKELHYKCREITGHGKIHSRSCRSEVALCVAQATLLGQPWLSSWPSASPPLSFLSLDPWGTKNQQCLGISWSSEADLTPAISRLCSRYSPTRTNPVQRIASGAHDSWSKPSREYSGLNFGSHRWKESHSAACICISKPLLCVKC